MADAPPSESKPLDQKTEAELKREAKARLKRLSPLTATQLVQETVRDKVGQPATGFIAFIHERAIVGLAIGFVIGVQVQTVAKSFITGFVNPLFTFLIPGNQVLSDHKWTWHINGHTADIGWGDLMYQLLDLFFLVFIIYLLVRIFKLDRLDKKS
jgi:large-conductance mechanosensitive channel